ncbi:MAG: 4-hydroxythreonine-4-phosphate dehydrogenase PdxA [Pirellulales bacterium]
MTLPIIAITLGDPAGIGPETILGAWSDPGMLAAGRLLIVGRPEIVARAMELKRLRAEIAIIEDPAEAQPAVDVVPVLVAGSEKAIDVPAGKLDARGGQAAYDALHVAAQLALAGKVDAIVTGPLNKAALNAAGHAYPGHTELLGAFCGVPQPAMMLYLPAGAGVAGPNGLGVLHATLHMSVRDALAALSIEGIVESCRLAHEMLSRLALTAVDDGEPRSHPKIGLCAVNPHASENGLFGSEETEIVIPAMHEARKLNLDVHGPFPADTIMVRARAGEYDGVVAMYHDQGHIALKLLGMHRAVNITCGLPIIRTSVAHGTAFEIAWQGVADCGGVIEAVRVAGRLCHKLPQTVEGDGAEEVF